MAAVDDVGTVLNELQRIRNGADLEGGQVLAAAQKIQGLSDAYIRAAAAIASGEATLESSGDDPIIVSFSDGSPDVSASAYGVTIAS